MGCVGHSRYHTAAAAVLSLALAATAEAAKFDWGDFEGTFTTTLSLGATWRMENQDRDYLSPGNTDGKGKARNITAANKAWDGSCAYSPDGRHIALRMHRRPGYESDRARLALLERQTGKLRVLTPTFDHLVDEFAWLPDSQRILFAAPVKGRWASS